MNNELHRYIYVRFRPSYNQSFEMFEHKCTYVKQDFPNTLSFFEPDNDDAEYGKLLGIIPIDVIEAIMIGEDCYD